MSIAYQEVDVEKFKEIAAEKVKETADILRSRGVKTLGREDRLKVGLVIAGKVAYEAHCFLNAKFDSDSRGAE